MAGEQDQLEVRSFAGQEEWSEWLDANHATSRGLWLKLAKKATGIPSVTYDEAVESALCYGWIDSLKKSLDDGWWLQKFTPRGRKSIWSRRNRQIAEALIERDAMTPAGLREIEAARADGRWDRAYAAQSVSTVPADLQAALDANPDAAAYFATLDSRNRYAILFRTETAKKSETRARRIEQFVEMLARHERLYP